MFGHDLHRESSGADNVVALMRSDERAFERQLADTLMEFGIVFRIEEAGKEPVAVVPEELWSSLWSTGRTWLMEWTAAAMEDAIDAGVRRSVSEAGEVDLQAAMKWFACEADRGTVRTNADVVADATLERLVAVGGHDARFWAERVELALELSALRVRRNGAVEVRGERSERKLPSRSSRRAFRLTEPPSRRKSRTETDSVLP